MVTLVGVKRKVPSTAAPRIEATPGTDGDMSTGPLPCAERVSEVIKELYNQSLRARWKEDPNDYLRKAAGKLFRPGTLTDAMVSELQCGQNELPVVLERRIKDLVSVWADAGFIDIGTATTSGPETPSQSTHFPPCDRWRAERISTPMEGLPWGYSVFFVTKPLVLANEALANGTRPVIDVEFPILT
jgi:hypothetical protein